MVINGVGVTTPGDQWVGITIHGDQWVGITIHGDQLGRGHNPW